MALRVKSIGFKRLTDELTTLKFALENPNIYISNAFKNLRFKVDIQYERYITRPSSPKLSQRDDNEWKQYQLIRMK